MQGTSVRLLEVLGSCALFSGFGRGQQISSSRKVDQVSTTNFYLNDGKCPTLHLEIGFVVDFASYGTFITEQRSDISLPKLYN